MKFRAALVVAAAASCVAKESDVVVLTNKDFGQTVNQTSLILVEFYAPWCGYCQKLAPKYEVAATTLKNQNITLAKVDCVAEEELCKVYEVTGFPTLKVFRDGIPSDYKGPREEEGIITYMKRQSVPAIVDLTSETADEFIQSESVVVVGFFDKADSDEQKLLVSVANQLRENFVFGKTVDVDLAKKHEVQTPGLVLFKKFNEGKNVFDGTWDGADLAAFVKTYGVPLVDEVGPENFSEYMKAGLPLAFLFVQNDEERKTLGAEVENVAKDFRGKINFVFIDAVKFGEYAKNLNLNKTWPAFVIHDVAENLKYPFVENQKITEAAVRTLAEGIVDGTAVPNIKSEPVPESNDEPVKVVVGSTFDDIVRDTNKDVLLEIYAPWCGHCKKLAPVYAEIGVLYKDAPDVTIAKMDGTVNDLPPRIGFRVDGYPIVKLFKAKDNTIVDYEGDRSLESLIKFITDNAVSSFTPSKESDTKEETVSKDASGQDEPHDEL